MALKLSQKCSNDPTPPNPPPSITDQSCIRRMLFQWNTLFIKNKLFYSLYNITNKFFKCALKEQYKNGINVSKTVQVHGFVPITCTYYLRLMLKM